ncbi:restriction endonuclease subunit S [Enterobacter kobei]|uniref:restriction endonuclease subunit S n=1 Tax=Enterobacter kobei TaxID=208224 RepID=UPI00214A5256|nr:restriction endonuclease subunit S [Enterobacter kobei]MCR2794927.1 restriction endonuclease subunit S [Enterobacter kobei]
MESDWTQAKLGDYIDSCLGKMLDKNKNTGEYHPYLGNSNVRWGEFELDDLAEMKFEAHEHTRYGLKKGDLIICEGGEPGRCAIWEDEIPNMKIQKALHRVRTLPGLDSEYLYYWFLFSTRAGHIEPFFTGTTIKHLTGKALKEIPIRIPPLTYQQYSAKLLRGIDKKITLNRQINQTLEHMAQALFKSWFVDFDPVVDNALDAGFFEQDLEVSDELLCRAEARKAARGSSDFKPLSDDIRQQFPAAFEECDEPSLGLGGWVPKGWIYDCFGELLSSTIGGDWGKDSQDEKHTTQCRIVRGTDIPNLISGQLSNAPLRWVEPKKLQSRQIEAGDIIIEVSGGSPTQSTGRSIFMTQSMLNRLGGVVEPASFCRRFKPKSFCLGILASLHLQSIYSDGKMWEYQNQSTGIANFQTKFFLDAERVLMPSDKVLESFCHIVTPLIEKSQNSEQVTLAKLRDTLLPKLISGELHFDEIESDLTKEG